MSNRLSKELLMFLAYNQAGLEE
ncbi:hypothetical protein BOSE62_110444 [Bosea sp. 62]|nr:hypothetical protein BOSE21B_50138 [Bosea sp. 21B]CAD5287307.1 hypothetical protein BOSE46_70134 [Bosea sp. 46]CAD5301672.1 hypothetical protein BOSE7B_90550 [Bosea sp. 7B]VVT51377.1 hypothetical protein BOS5A_110313 [Bosea sp. EC-HK365B]VXB12734.1 hypothetical protein BOSE62_110444 [Bosea sp. 62]VXB74170.1 hypothetical protein BOSE127_140494 [Bosea sp. 127]VXC55333.1 hypothetical protein BOSE29B_50133 [Bosea sp. 29B]VXC89647.1 hypothetical protein BOSE125_70198 [Bosea sp. 125]